MRVTKTTVPQVNNTTKNAPELPLAHERDHHIKLLLDYTDLMCALIDASLQSIANVGFNYRQ